MSAQTSPVFERLTAARSPLVRQHLLHQLEKMLDAHPHERSLAQRVHHVVDRGLPYFSPSDPHYQAWAKQVADLWRRAEALTAAK